MVAVSQKLVNPGGETLVIEYTSSDLSFTASGVVTLTDTMNEKDIAWAILSEMAELSQDAYWCWWSSGHGFLNSNGRLGPGQIS